MICGARGATVHLQRRIGSKPAFFREERTLSLNPQLYPVIPPITDGAPRPFWSVLVPAYKPQYLAQALRSALDQDPGPEQMELIVVDDCSPHALEPVVREAAGSRAVYVRHEANLGTYATQNTALRMARGRWIHILNDDDWVLPRFYATFRASLENQPEAVGVACCRYVNTDAEGRTTFTPPVLRPEPGPLSDWVQKICVTNPVHPIAVVVRRSTHERVGGYCPALKYTADWEFNQRAALFFQWWYQPEILACYREHNQSASREGTTSTEMIDELARVARMIEPHLPDEIRAKTIAASLKASANLAMLRAEQAFNRGDTPTGTRLIQAGLRLSTAPAVLQNAASLLAHPAAEPLRQLLPQFIQRIELQ